MPEPQSRRGNVITSANFEAPFETLIVPCGVGGLDLASALDRVAPGSYARLTNVTWTPEGAGQMTGRPGQTPVATAPTSHLHSAVRLDNIETLATTYLWGAGTILCQGVSGALTQIDTGYSGDPITFLPVRPALSGDPWTYLADSAKMAKVRDDGLVLPIGLPAPDNAVTAALDTEQKTVIADNSGAGDVWTPGPGLDYSTPQQIVPAGLARPSAAGTIFDATPTAAILAAGNGYWSVWGMAKTLNLNQVGAVPASDDDFIHLKLKFGNPALVAEARLYFVCSSAFSPTILPGAAVDTDGNPVGDTNQDYYLKVFRPSDFTPMAQSYQAQVIAAEQARVNQIRQDFLERLAQQEGFIPPRFEEKLKRALDEKYPPVRVNDTFAAQLDPSRDRSVQGGGAGDQFVEFGTIGLPLRRSDFKRYGSTADRDWGTITGIVVYLQALPNAAVPNPSGHLLIFVDIQDLYLTGGSGPDTSEPAAQSYDYRVTNYDPRTGAESNPSPIMDQTLWLDSLRRSIVVSPAAYNNSAIRQRIYRRGGGLTGDWYYVGVNDSDGGSFTDGEPDLAIAAAGTVEIDHYQPVATVDDAGNTVLAQPVPILFGPYNNQLLALGDPYRPGFVYASKPGEYDHWPPDLSCEVCPASEELLNGVMYGGQPFVFSRSAGYPLYGNLTGQTGLTAAPAQCKHGLAGRWAVTVGAGAIWFIATDNAYMTQGGVETPIANELIPLFRGEVANGYRPIDFTDEAALRLAIYQNELWLGYRDDQGDLQIVIYQILTKRWRHYEFAHPPSLVWSDRDTTLWLGAEDSGILYIHTGTDDGGVAIEGRFRTGAWDFSRPREEKLFGDQILDVDPQNVDLSWRNFLNQEAVPNAVQTITGFTGRQRVILDSFGTTPQRARTIMTHVAWSTDGPPPIFYQYGTAITLQPDLTINRVTNWDDLGHPDEKYLMGLTLDCDTGGEDRTIVIERDLNGAISTVATLTVNADGRHKLVFSWTALQAHMVRIRPDDTCLPWILYRADWIAQNEPPRIAAWDSYFENAWDQYYTGLDLMCDTGGATKTLIVEVDGVALVNPATGLASWAISASGRRVVHLTLPTGRGHVFRFYATDTNPGLLYQHRWHLVEEPSEQANWNQPYTTLGTQADKYVKAVIFEVDTFGQDKTVAIEADGVVVDTLTVNATGRQVVQLALPTGQRLGRVWRFIPTDAWPSRLYSLRLVFDEEPFALMRWETQWIDHGLSGFHYLIDAMISLKSTSDVTVTVEAMANQATGATTTDTYTITTTSGVKQKRFLPFQPRNGILYKYTLTAAAPFWLYMEESFVTLLPFLGGEPLVRHPFGNAGSDLPTRTMVNSTLAAERSGGGA